MYSGLVKRQGHLDRDDAIHRPAIWLLSKYVSTLLPRVAAVFTPYSTLMSVTPSGLEAVGAPLDEVVLGAIHHADQLAVLDRKVLSMICAGAPTASVCVPLQFKMPSPGPS